MPRVALGCRRRPDQRPVADDRYAAARSAAAAMGAVLVVERAAVAPMIACGEPPCGPGEARELLTRFLSLPKGLPETSPDSTSVPRGSKVHADLREGLLSSKDEEAVEPLPALLRNRRLDQ